MKKRRIIATIAALCILSTALAGCGSRTEEVGTQSADGQPGKEGEQKTVPLGRYVEESIEMPELAETESVLSMVDGSDGIDLYTYKGETETAGGYFTYRLGQDGTWEREETAWLNKAFGGKQELIQEIRKGEENSLYAWYFDGDYKAHFIKTTDGENVEQINIAFFDNKENIPNGFAVTGKGELAVAMMGGSLSDYIVLFNTEDGSELQRFRINDMGSDNISSSMDAAGNKLVAVSEDGRNDKNRERG